jgi:hypothetical protein
MQSLEAKGFCIRSCYWVFLILISSDIWNRSPVKCESYRGVDGEPDGARFTGRIAIGGGVRNIPVVCQQVDVPVIRNQRFIQVFIMITKQCSHRIPSVFQSVKINSAIGTGFIGTW